MRVTPTGQKFFVMDLPVKILEDNVFLQNYSGSRNSSLNLLADFLGLKNFQLTASDTFLKTNTTNYILKIGQGFKDYTGDPEITAAVKIATPTLIQNKNQPDRKDDYYYVIRESIRSNNYEFSFGNDITANQQFRAALLKLASAGQGYTYNQQDSGYLKFTNSSIAYRVLFIAEKIGFRAGANGSEPYVDRTLSEGEIQK